MYPPVSANSPLELNQLRGARKSEAQDRLIRETRAGQGQDAQGTKLLLGFLGQDEAEDPYTGREAQGRQSQYDDALDFFRPDVAARRHEEQNYQLQKTAIPGQTAIQVAHINADAKAHAADKAGWAEPTVTIPDPHGTGAVYQVPRSVAADPVKAKQFIASYQDNGIPGTRGQADRSKIDAFRTLIAVMGEAERAGRAANWQGVGPMSRITAPLYHFGGPFSGLSNPAEENLRSVLKRVESREAFGEGGKQLSPTEWNLISQFLASTTQNPEVINARLGSGYTHAATVLRSLGAPDADVAQWISQARGPQ